MNICWVTLKVKDMKESLKFYTEIMNLKVSDKFTTPNNMEIVMLGEDNEPKIELIYDENHLDIKPSCDTTIGFTVDSLDDTISMLKENNIELKGGPISPSENIIFLFIEDPNGYVIQLVEKR